ncbi:uncharacterized protein LOC110852002 isoform X3 [Folsomia candida]|uniref:Uncharacterized protein n=1 Tax=Folsomia candida TaxID=158441 RepID=A0A226E4E1_FOLCA|nr:uncharacterized protein LOC110852002 isoform X3 [Folsomia candida]OXA51356.1 hypothetical protein Fcan01_13331 [Folsomia candida]
MGRLKIDLALALFAIIFVNCVVQSEYYIEQPTHIYVVGGPDSDDAVSVEEDEVVAVSPQNAQFQSRRGVASSDEDESESEDNESVEEKHQRTKGRPRPIKLPSNFDEIVRRKLQLAKRQRRPLHGDPSPIMRHDEDDEERKPPASRLLWPFSIEISKGKDGWGPGHYGSYDKGPHHGHGEPHPINFGAHDDDEYDPDDDPEVQKLRLEMYKMVTRAKKWKKILKYNLAEVGAQIFTKGIEFLEFI